MRRLAALLLLALGFAAQAAAAPAPPQQVVRYHLGDDPDGKLGWAKPDFDDSSWPVAKDEVVPSPPYYSDGMVWIRVHLPVAANATAPLALQEENRDRQPGAQAIFVNGRQVGGYGALPPGPQAFAAPPQRVFELPDGLAPPGSMAVAVIRAWSAPADRGSLTYQAGLTIDSAELAHLRDAYQGQLLFLPLIPEFAIELALALIGLGLAVLWAIMRRRDLGLFALFLILTAIGLLFFRLQSSSLLCIPMRWDASCYFVVMFFGSVVFLELAWSVLGLGGRPWKYLAILAAFVGTLSYSYVQWTHQATPLVAACLRFGPHVSELRDAIEFGAMVWALVFRPRRRLFAFLLMLPLAGSYLEGLFDIDSFQLGFFTFSYFTTGILFVDLGLVWLLLHDAWSSWRRGKEYRVEMEAARQVQQRLVPVSLPAVAGYRVEAAYLPAQEVGGDFYQILPQQDGSTLVVVGDVSGKGLKAAMNGMVAIGVTRALASEQLSPGMLLTRLNAELAGSQDGGFITGLCVHVAADGAVVLANAGHLAPYCNGEEVEVDAGLPLGIATGIVYAENSLKLAVGDRLLMLSDGVVEARNAAGELFGFARTQAISGESAEKVAQAAQAFGQEDDITVVTLTLLHAEVAHA